MKRITWPFILLAIAMCTNSLANAVDAGDFPDDMISQIVDDTVTGDGEADQYGFYESYIGHDSFQAQLYVELDTKLEYSEEGDIFLFIVRVTNVGNYPAIFTKVKLVEIPADWRVFPIWKSKMIPIIFPGNTARAIFLVRKGPTHATVYATAKAKNSEEATSEAIPIPVFWTTVALISAGIILSTTYYYRRR